MAAMSAAGIGLGTEHNLERRQQTGKALSETPWTNTGINDDDEHNLERRQQTGKALSETPWTDTGINDDDENNWLLCVLERLIEEHIAISCSSSVDIILPQDSKATLNNRVNTRGIMFAADVPWRSDLRHFVSEIKLQHNLVSFHSYHHATHVTLSASRLMAGLAISHTRKEKNSSSSQLRPPLGNITALEKIAFVFAALIHDVSHNGVSNAQLETENHPVYLAYSDPVYMSSYAECNSVDISLELLRKDTQYCGLSEALFGSKIEAMSVFDGLVRHLVICTDIASADRRRIGMERWEQSFGSSLRSEGSTEDKSEDIEASQLHRRCVLEQLIQLSDVSHLTQSWDTFLKWNGRLYLELTEAHHRKLGDDSTGNMPPPHPSEGWYEDQIGFYDFYIIPLAKRVQGCGVLEDGMSLMIVENAKRIRDRWVEEGRLVTDRMVSSASTLAGNCLQSLPYKNAEDPTLSDSSLGEESDTRIADLGEIGRVDSGSVISVDETAKRAQVNATVPRLLVGQILRSIQKGCCICEQKGGTRTRYETEEKMHRAIASYWQTGSLERYRAAVLFVDISGFTHLSQVYAVDHFKTFINGYFTKIIAIITAHGGEVAKFAGDALYAIWTTPRSSGGSTDGEQVHAINVSRSIACGAAVITQCNNYRISRTYARGDPLSSRRARSHSLMTISSGNLDELRLADGVSVDADGAGYEEKVSLLNVHCGVAEGAIAGIDVCANNRSEFFLIGRALSDVAQAESKARVGQLVISPSVKQCVDAYFASLTAMLEGLTFVECGDGFLRIKGARAPHTPAQIVVDLSANLKVDRLVETALSSMHRVGIEDEKEATESDNLTLRTSNDFKWTDRTGSFGYNQSNQSPSFQYDSTLNTDIVSIVESHIHESVRSISDNMMTAELRNVAVLFIKVLYEPELSTATNCKKDDDDILEHFQSIFKTIHGCLSPRKGQVRQFISDDKGTVCIASFGLRGSATLHVSATAVETARDIQSQLLQVASVDCTIGITLGKAFCGETGSSSRHEFSIIGSSVNLSARLMAKGAIGTVNCDDKIARNDNDHEFTCTFKHRLKGYNKLVPFYNPATTGNKDQENSEDGGDNLTSISVRQEEIEALVDRIQIQQDIFEREQEQTTTDTPIAESGGEEEEDARASGPHPRAVLVSARDGSGKTQFIQAVLEHPAIKARTTILVANHCYHNTPFYCWIPIISNIIKSSKYVVKRIAKLKRLRRKINIPPSLLTNAADNRTPRILLGNDELVTKELVPYLALLNDFIFQGLTLFRSTEEVLLLREAQKVDKVIEVLSAIIRLYMVRCRKSTIIVINAIDSVDSYSKQLIQTLFASENKLIFICSSKGATRRNSSDSIRSRTSLFSPESIFGDTAEERTEIMRLEPLGKRGMFQVFSKTLRGVPEEEKSQLDTPAIVKRVHEVCGGIPKYAFELAHAISIELYRLKKTQQQECSSDQSNVVARLLNEFPLSKMEELITFRFDALSPDAQVLLKVASVTGFDKYSFSLSMLEVLMLKFAAEDNVEGDRKDDGIPMNIGQGQRSKSQFEHIFQGDKFETLVQSLVERGFLMDIDANNADYNSDDEMQCYRFANSLEQTVINDLMLEEQKKRLHLALAEYYEEGLSGLASHNDYLMDDYGDEGSISTMSTMTSTLSARNSWQMIHLTATHYSQAGVPARALLYFFDAATELARLGLRDKAHGSLLLAYSMFEKRVSQALRNDKIINAAASSKERNRLSKILVQLICDTSVPPTFKTLTKDHLQWMFDGDNEAFVACIKMIFKFGQSIGVTESEGYLHGPKVYQQVVFLTLLGLSQNAFHNTALQLSEYFDASIKEVAQLEDKDESFCINDLTVSFPAFSGLLTFYRDSPIQNESNLAREKILAKLFVAITEQQSDMVHTLRTNCILSHLYMKIGDVEKALGVSETIKEAYDHDEHSFNIVQLYGMDWALINITAMVSVYILRGDIMFALDSISFLEAQLEKLDEFASSTKAMLKGSLSSTYLLLRRFDKAVAVSQGISSTSYGYFYKPNSILQEGLNRKLEQPNLSLQSLGTSTKSIGGSLLSSNLEDALGAENPNAIFSDDFNVLHILDTKQNNTVCFKRSMLHPSAEVLCNRGMEATEAAICMTQIEWLEKSKQNENKTSANQADLNLVKEQMQYCEAGLSHLNQSLGQNDAASHEKRTNYLSCLYQRSELLSWRNKLRIQFESNNKDDASPSTVPCGTSASDDTEEAKSALRECANICDENNYYLMLIMTGVRFVNLDLDAAYGREIISRGLEAIHETKLESDLLYVTSICDHLLRYESSSFISSEHIRKNQEHTKLP